MHSKTKKDKFRDKCLTKLESITNKFNKKRDEKCAYISKLDHFGEGCFYLDEGIRSYRKEIADNSEELLKKIFAGISLGRGMIYVYNLHEGVFEEWVEIEFPFLLFKDEWKTFLDEGDDFDKFKKRVEEYVKNKTNMHSKSISRLPPKEKVKYVDNWNDILKEGSEDLVDTDYWKLGIILFNHKIVGYNKKKMYTDKIDKNGETEALFKGIYSIHRSKCEKQYEEFDIDPLLKYLKVPTIGIAKPEKRKILKAHIQILPIPPLYLINVEMQMKPLATMIIEIKDDKITNISKKRKERIEGCLNIMAENFLKTIIIYWTEMKKRLDNQEDVENTFNNDFLISCAKHSGFNNKCGEQIKETKQNERKIEKDPLVPFFFNVKFGFAKSLELSLKTIVDFFANIYPGVLIDQSILVKFKDMEKLLFWLEEYREHLIHSMKVYLLGRAIIGTSENGSGMISQCIKSKTFKRVYELSNINDNNDRKKEEVVKFAWACAAFMHDLTIGLENIEEAVAQFITKLTTKKPENVSKLENIQNGFSEWFTNENSFFSFFKLLYVIMRYGHNCKDFAMPDIFNDPDFGKKFPFSNEFKDFLGKGDHGVTSSLSYLIQVFPNLNYRYPGGNINFDEDSWKNNPFLHLKIAEAILKHNLLFKTVVKPNCFKEGDFKKVKPVFFLAKEYCVNFSENPIAFLLLLCDTLQDWGREESSFPYKCELNGTVYEISKRPYSHITKIEPNNDSIVIHIDYRWIRKNANSKKNKELSKCPWSKEDDRKSSYSKHRLAPQECRKKVKDWKNQEYEYECLENECKVITNCINHLKEVFKPRLQLGNRFEIILKIKYHGKLKDTIVIN